MIHKFKSNGMNIVLDVNSGAVHLVDDLSYELLEHINEKPLELSAQLKKSLYSKYSEAAVEGALTELAQLADEGMLFTDDEYIELENYHLENAPVKAMCLHIAHDCNLKCEYCFADGGEYHQIRQLMPYETAKAAIDYLITASKGRKNLEIDFFGGEPLLNFEVVKQTVEYARQQGKAHGKNFRFTITTNGLLLDDAKIAYINDNMDNVVISLDGRKEVNDKVRKRLDGSGCYERILPRFQKLAESRGQDKYYIRGTFTRYNLDFDKDVMHLADLGFKQISVEPVTGPSDMPYTIRCEDLPEIDSTYDRLAQQMLKGEAEGKGFNFFHFMIDFEGGPCVIKRLSGCGSGNEYVAVTPSGDIYPCHQFVGSEQFLMGNVEHGIANKDIKREFSASNVYSKEKCKNCFAKFYCSGGCNANNFFSTGSILEPDDIACHLMRKRTECAIMIKAAAVID